MTQNIQNTNENNMATLSTCMASILKLGYEENFKVKNGKLYAPSAEKAYHPASTHIDNFYRFEGASDPADNAVLYAITTDDGTKGMLLDAYGTYADEAVNKFIKDVQDIHKENATE